MKTIDIKGTPVIVIEELSERLCKAFYGGSIKICEFNNNEWSVAKLTKIWLGGIHAKVPGADRMWHIFLGHKSLCGKFEIQHLKTNVPGCEECEECRTEQKALFGEKATGFIADD